MKSIRNKKTASLLVQLLKNPHLPEEIRSQSPRQLAQLIKKVGLEDAGEIVAFARVGGSQ